MPVRSLHSSVLRWPDRGKVDEAVRRWARQELARHPRTLRLGYFGSYARGDWGVGSDLDLVAVVADAPQPFAHRSLDWDLGPLPVPAQLLVYTQAEWDRMLAEGNRFARTLARETVWIHDEAAVPGCGRSPQNAPCR